MIRYDAIIIGTGQSGPPLAGRLTSAGMKVAIVERKKFGGTCVNTGCIPTKTLVASARTAYIARRGGDFGVLVPGPVTVDMKRVKARKEEIVRLSHDGVESSLKKMENCTVIEGQARFTGPGVVQVGDQILTAEKIFINVGGRASIPAIPGLDRVRYFTNSSMMDVDFLPQHLVIIGGSYVGLEFAQMYKRFGSEVTVIEREARLVPREDEDISLEIRKILENEGVRVVTGASDLSVGDGPAVKMRLDGKPFEVAGSLLLVAAGRVPNTGDLGLDAAGIALDRHGYMEVDDQLRTSAAGVWAMGDCNGRGAFTHTSYNDFEIVAANLLDNDPRRVSDRILAYNIYIDPPLGRAGMTEKQVRASGRKALIGTRPMTEVARAVEKGETQGFLKILVDAESHLILGASLLGVECDEAIHCILDIMYAKAPYTVIQRAVHIHPTVSELIPTVLGDLKPLV